MVHHVDQCLEEVVWCTHVNKCLEEVVRWYAAPCRQMFRGGRVVHPCRQMFRGGGVVHPCR